MTNCILKGIGHVDVIYSEVGGGNSSDNDNGDDSNNDDDDDDDDYAVLQAVTVLVAMVYKKNLVAKIAVKVTNLVTCVPQ